MKHKNKYILAVIVMLLLVFVSIPFDFLASRSNKSGFFNNAKNVFYHKFSNSSTNKKQEDTKKSSNSMKSNAEVKLDPDNQDEKKDDSISSIYDLNVAEINDADNLTLKKVNNVSLTGLNGITIKRKNNNLKEDNSETRAKTSNHELMSRLIESEAGSESYEGKIAVGNVVLNRCKIEGKNIAQIIYELNQFDGVKSNNFLVEPSSESRKAAEEVISGKNVVPEAFYFADLKLCSTKPDFAKDEKFIIQIGNHSFYKK